MKETIIKTRFGIGDTVHWMNGRGIPNQGIVKGFFSYIPDHDCVTTYAIQRSEKEYKGGYDEYSDTELFDTYEALIAKRSIISPHRAVELLKKHKQKPVWFLTEKNVAFLEKRAEDYRPAKK
jgi:hypothetical protein